MRHGVSRPQTRVGEEAPPVHRDCGKDAGGTVGGRCDDPPACGVLLVDGEREGPEPLPGDLPHAARFDGLELFADRAGAALDLQDAGEHAVRVQAGIHASGHGVPDRVKAGSDVRLGSHRHLVLTRDVGDRDAAFVAQRDQRGGIGVVERERPRRDLRLIAVSADESAADRIVGVLKENAAVGGMQAQRHGVRVSGQPSTRRELDVVLGEGNGVLSGDEQLGSLGEGRPGCADLVRIARLGFEPAKAGHDGIRCTVADPGRAERAVKRARHAGGIGESTVRSDSVREVERRPHRSDRVRARRPHPDGEQVEGRDVRSHLSRLRHPIRLGPSAQLSLATTPIATRSPFLRVLAQPCFRRSTRMKARGAVTHV